VATGDPKLTKFQDTGVAIIKIAISHFNLRGYAVKTANPEIR
jgi:hypothetical protein